MGNRWPILLLLLIASCSARGQSEPATTTKLVVVDVTGAGISNAAVRIPAIDWRGKAASSGSIELPPLPAGTVVIIKQQGFRDTQVITGSSLRTTTVVMQIDPYGDDDCGVCTKAPMLPTVELPDDWLISAAPIDSTAILRLKSRWKYKAK